MDKQATQKGNNMKWIFNPLMIWGAVLGFLIFSGIGLIQDTWRHHGPGHVWYEQPDRMEKVPENQYKRHEYVSGGLLLAVGLGLWIVIANGAKKGNKKDHKENV